MGGVAGGQSAGGSLQLVKLIDEHGPALLADLRDRGLDIRDLWRDGSGLTPRYVLWLVGQLPESSAFAASVRGGAKYRSWTLHNHLTAALVNLTVAANYQRAGKRPKKPPIVPPKPTVISRNRARGARVMRVTDLPGARKVAGR